MEDNPNLQRFLDALSKEYPTFYQTLNVSLSPKHSPRIASWDNNVIIWDFPPLQDLINETRERFKDRPLTPEERRQYYLE